MENSTTVETEALSQQVTVLVIEDHPIVRYGCRRICSRRPDIETLEAISVEERLAVNRSFTPDVIILDIELGEASGFDIMPRLMCDNPRMQIIVFSMYEAARFAVELMAAG